MNTTQNEERKERRYALYRAIRRFQRAARAVADLETIIGSNSSSDPLESVRTALRETTSDLVRLMSKYRVPYRKIVETVNAARADVSARQQAEEDELQERAQYLVMNAEYGSETRTEATL